MNQMLKNKNDREDDCNLSLKKQKLADHQHENAPEENLDYQSDEETFSTNSKTHSENVGIKERINKDFKRFKGSIKQT